VATAVVLIHPRLTPQLVKLDLSGNHLEEVENLETLSRLQFLNLSYNRITSVLNLFRAVGNIATLILRGNQLTSLKGIEKLVGLVRLDLRDNALRCSGWSAAQCLHAVQPLTPYLQRADWAVYLPAGIYKKWRCWPTCLS